MATLTDFSHVSNECTTFDIVLIVFYKTLWKKNSLNNYRCIYLAFLSKQFFAFFTSLNSLDSLSKAASFTNGTLVADLKR